MGVYIRGMEMPTSCLECAFYRRTDPVYDYCCISSAIPKGYVPDDCPLFPVPPHGRLIDADALIADIRANSESYFADDFAHEWVDVAPTIIPAEEGE